MSWRHNELAHDLAETLRAGDRVVWEDMQLGPSGSPRPDVYTVPKSYSKFRPIAYEVKISVADFRRDITAGKWQSYLRFASGVIFAVPAGLVNKQDVPVGCGLMVRGESAWTTVKGPTLKVVDSLPQEAWLKLLIDGISRQRQPIKERSANSWLYSKKSCEVLGERVAIAMRSIDRAEIWLKCQLDALKEKERGSLDEQKKLEDQIRARANAAANECSSIRKQLTQALGMEEDASYWEMRRVVADMVESLDRDLEIQRLKKIIDRLRRDFDDAVREIPLLNMVEA